MMESEWHNSVAAYVAALSHLVKKPGEFVLLSETLPFPSMRIITLFVYFLGFLFLMGNGLILTDFGWK